MKISTVIVTKDRAKILQRCLRALSAQSKKLDELVVVDNDSTDSTKEVVKKFSQQASFPVRYVLEKKVSYPSVYNRGLAAAKYNWVAFIDDDCLASKNWFHHAKACVKKFPKVAAVLGASGTQQPKNIFSLLTLFADEYWKKNQISGQKIGDLEILDNKNIIYSKKFLKKHRLRFDESLAPFFNGACEDSDLGMQLQQAGGEAVYSFGMKIRHQDPDNFSWYYKKLITSTQSHLLYEKRWQHFRETINIQKKFNSWQLFTLYGKRYQLNLPFSFQFLLHLYVSFLIVRGVKTYQKLLWRLQ